MARRTRPGPGDAYDDGGPPRTRRRKSGGAEGIIIALALAGVVGIVMFFVVSSGSSGDEEKEAARIALRELFETCLKNDERKGVTLVDPRQILADIQKRMKEWNFLEQKERDEFAAQAWRLIRGRVTKDLQLEGKGMPDVDMLLSAATAEFVPSRGEVAFVWTFLGENWRARLRREGQIAWVVFDFRQEGR